MHYIGEKRLMYSNIKKFPQKGNKCKESYKKQNTEDPMKKLKICLQSAY